jgi:hypothetical protein
MQPVQTHTIAKNQSKLATSRPMDLHYGVFVRLTRTGVDSRSLAWDLGIPVVSDAG